MTVKEAAHQLYARLCPGYQIPGWLSSIGVAEISEYNDKDYIVIYLRRERYPDFVDKLKDNGYNGYPIEVKYFGEFAPLGKVED
jgi:hypothetical protein